MRKSFLVFNKLFPVRPLRFLQWNAAVAPEWALINIGRLCRGGGLTALLATSAICLPDLIQAQPPFAHVTSATPGQPVDIVDPVVKYISHTTAAAMNSLKPSAGAKEYAADNAEYPPGAVKPDFPGAKPRVLTPRATGKTLVPAPVDHTAAKLLAKPQPKYSMKPIVAGDAPAATAPVEKLAEKAAEVKKPVVAAKKTPVVSKAKKTAIIAPVAKPKVREAKPAAKVATKPAKVKQIKVQVVKVEANTEAVAAAKAKAAEPKQAPVKVAPPKAEPVKAGPVKVEVAKTQTPKVEVPKVEPVKVEAAKAVVKEVVKETAKPENVSKIAPKVEFSTEGEVEKLKFTFSTPVAAAVFERFGYYWLVFYTDDQLTLPEDLKKSKLFGATKKVNPAKAELISVDNTLKAVAAPLVFTMELNRGVYAMVQKSGTTWEIDFDPGIDFKQESALKFEEKPDSWMIDAKGISAHVTVKDDFTNDYVEIFPLTELGFNPKKNTSGKVVFEKTVQGLALKTIGQVEIKSPEKDKLAVYKGANATSAGAEMKKPEAHGGPIYAFQKWPQLKADEYRKAEAKLRDGNHLEFGKFLFSQGLYSEAAVNLQGERGIEASFLTGASYYMLGRYEDAGKIFDSLVLPDSIDANELLMWKAAANFALGQVNPGAAKPVDLTNFSAVKSLDNYPDEIRNRLIFGVAEKQISDGKFDDAMALLNMLPKAVVETPSQSYMKYLQGKIYDGQGKHARAREVWVEVAKSATDRESQAKSAYEVIIQDYNGGKIKPEEAVSRLNDIRILWRGDIFEYTLLNQLADLYAKQGASYEALATSKEILSSFPNFPHNLAIANQMRDIYQKVVTTNFTDKEKTFQAVTIYYEFEELKPPGEKGDQITLQLADALARYDLLVDSAKVLKKYSVGVVDKAQKAEISTRIAILKYLDNKPKDALAELKESTAPDLPPYLVQERRILEVRCLIETGDLEQAMSLLSALPDEQASRFKADIFWKQKKWDEMIGAYDMVTQKNDEDIMRLGIAYVMQDDKKALQNLAKRYTAQMDKGPYAQNFAYITDVENVDYRNLDASLKLDKTQELLQKYRDRIKTNGLGAVTGAGQKQ